MNSTEKKDHIENAIEAFLNNSSTQIIKNKLTAKRISKHKANEIIESAFHQIQTKFGYKIKNHLTNNTLDSNMNEFAMLHSDLFEKIKNQQIEYLKYDTSIKIKKLVLEGFAEYTIVKKINPSYLTKAEIQELIRKEKKAIQKRNKSKKITSLFLGSLMVILAILQFNFDFGGESIWELWFISGIGLILYGIGLYKNEKY